MRKNIKTAGIGCVLVLLLGLSTAWREDPLAWVQPFLTRLNTYLVTRPIAQVFVHTNQTTITPGETLWFATHQTLGVAGVPDTMNRIVYLELRSPDDTLMYRLTVPTQHGRGWGQIDVPRTALPGTYQVVAYSNYQRNWGDSAVFRMPLEVVSATSAMQGSLTRSRDAKDEYLEADLLLLHRTGKLAANRSVTLEWRDGNLWRRIGSSTTSSDGALKVRFTANLPQRPVQVALRWLDEKADSNRHVWIVPPDGTKPRLRFFPEGGDLVAGVPNRVAVESIDAFGKPVAVRGKLLVGNQPPIELATDAQGQGMFIVAPEEGQPARVEADGYGYELPQVRTAGVTMNCTARDTNFRIALHPSAALALRMANQRLLVVAHQQGMIRHVTTVSVGSKWANASIPHRVLSPGVFTVTVFGNDGLPYAERLLYMQPTTPEVVATAQLTGTAGRRSSRTLQLQVRLPDGAAQQARLSASIEDVAAPFEATTHTEIRQYLQLGQLLTQPSHLASLTPQQLEWVLLARGWRRFTWQDLPNPTNLPYAIEQGLAVSGQLVQANGKPYVNQQLSMMALGDSTFIRFATTDEEGRFAISGFSFRDTMAIVLRPIKFKGINAPSYNFDITPKLADARYVRSLMGYAPAAPDATAYITQAREQTRIRRIASGEYELDEVTIAASKPKPKTRAEIFGKTYSDAAVTHSVNSDRFQPGVPFSFALAGVPGVQVRQSSNPGEPPSILIRGANSINSSTEPLILLDNVATTADVIPTLNTLDIDHVDVISGGGAAMFGARGANGVIAIFTKRGAGANFSPDTRLGRLVLQGLHQPREFAAPDYSVAKPEHASADLRTTLYWNPNIVLDAEGKASLPFYQADRASRMRIRVSGVTSTGIPVSINQQLD